MLSIFFSLWVLNCKSHKTASVPWGENFKSEIKDQQMHNRKKILWQFLIFFFPLIVSHNANSLYTIWDLNPLFICSNHSVFLLFFIFLVNINPQICMVLAIFEHTCPFSQRALRFLASRLFSFSIVIFCKQLKLYGMGHLLLCSTILKILSGMSYRWATGPTFFLQW